MVRNYVEAAVEQLFDGLLNDYKKKDPKICTCEKCRDDMKALALNSIPPHYAVTTKGIILTQVNFELIGGKAQVTSALLNAIRAVGANPRH